MRPPNPAVPGPHTTHLPGPGVIHPAERLTRSRTEPVRVAPMFTGTSWAQPRPRDSWPRELLEWERTAPMTIQTSDGPPRGIWTAIIMLTALMICLVIGTLSWCGGANGPHAVIAAGATFTGTTLFGFSVFNFLTGHGA
jgi:hypothetical protein